MGLLLFILAYLLFLPLSLLNWLLLVFKGKAKGYFRSSAISIDCFAGREFRTLFNAVLIRKQGYRFGDIRETVSSVLGKNKRDNTLSGAGKALAWLLDQLDKNHCENSILDL